MLKSALDAVMERRAARLLELVHDWLPAEGCVLDVGSGTGHVPALLRESGTDVVTADVSDIHVTGPPPILIDDGVLPFRDRTFSVALMFFMLAYPSDPAAVLREAARVAGGRIVLVQSVYSGRIGHAWHRGREFVWTILAFHVSRLVGYVPPDAEFSMRTRRFYTAAALEREVAAAGLRIRARRARPVLPRHALTVAAWLLESDE